MQKFEADIIVPGEPKAQKRHRSHMVKTKAGKSFMTQYDPSKASKDDFLAIVRQNAPNEPIRGPVALQLKFFFSRPNNHFGTGKNASKLKESAPEFHTSKPDGDNLYKFVTDAMTKVFWHDDASIVVHRVEKRYSANPRIEIYIREL